MEVIAFIATVAAGSSSSTIRAMVSVVVIVAIVALIVVVVRSVPMPSTRRHGVDWNRIVEKWIVPHVNLLDDSYGFLTLTLHETSRLLANHTD